MGRYIHVAGNNRGPCVLKHKYHRHWNHRRPRVGFWGILGVPSIELLFGEGSGRRALSTPPPPETKTRHGTADSRQPDLPLPWEREFYLMNSLFCCTCYLLQLF